MRTELVEFLIENTPLKYDMNSEDLKYDSKSPYYKIYKYLLSKEQAVEKAIEWVENNVYFSDEQNEFTEEANPEELLAILREDK